MALIYYRVWQKGFSARLAKLSTGVIWDLIGCTMSFRSQVLRGDPFFARGEFIAAAQEEANGR